MTIDEAILREKEVAEKNYLQGMLCHANPNDDELDEYIKCGKEHEQLAAWLEELKELRAYKEKTEKQIPKKVIRVQTKYGSPCRCPHCEADISEVHFIDVSERNHKEKITWCWNCGNAIDWSVEE